MQKDCYHCQSQDSYEADYEDIEPNNIAKYSDKGEQTKIQHSCNCRPKVKNFERKCCYKQKWFFTETRPVCGNWQEC